MKNKKAKVRSIADFRDGRGLDPKNGDSSNLGLSSVENIRIAIGSIVWEGFLIESMLKEILTNVIPREFILKSKRLKNKPVEKLTLGGLISLFDELGVNKPLVSRAFKWKDERNDIVHHIQKIMLEHNANQSSPEGRANFYSYLLDVLNEALEIKIRFSALKLWHDQNILGYPLPSPTGSGRTERMFSVFIPSAYEDFELHKFGFGRKEL